jgi:hypothetical protein
MTREADSLDSQAERRPGAWVVGDEFCVSVEWSPGANYAEPAG